MEALTLALVIGLGISLVDWIAYARGKDWSSFAKVGTAYAVFVALTWLCSVASVTEGIGLYGVTFGTLDGASIVLVGLLLAGGATGIVVKGYKAIDNSQSAATPKLL